MSNPQLGLVIDKLSKRYGNTDPLAVNRLSISVNPGEVYGFLGPNGSGKSTTIRLLLNFIQPSSGTATINGMDIVRDTVAIKASLGYLSGDFSAYEKMTGKQFLNYMSDLNPMPNSKYKNVLIKSLQLDASKKLNQLSKGNRQKIGIIQALMHQPDVIILDEPTDGLDPLMQEVFYDLIRDAKKRNAIIFISSHNLSEVGKVCDRVGIIKAGNLVAEKAIAELQKIAAQTLEVSFDGKPPLAALRAINGVKIKSHDASTIVMLISGDLQQVLKVLALHKVHRISTHDLDLDQQFMQYYEKEVK